MEEDDILPVFQGCLTALQNRKRKAREQELHQEFNQDGPGKKDNRAFMLEITALARERERLQRERNTGPAQDEND